MSGISKWIFFVLGVFSFSYGIAKWHLVSVVSEKQRTALKDYADSQVAKFFQSIDPEQGNETPWMFPEDLRRLMGRPQLSWGSNMAMPEMILVGGIGLIFFAIADDFQQRSARIEMRKVKAPGRRGS